MNFCFFYTFCQTVIRKREKKKRKESFIDEESIHVNLNFFFFFFDQCQEQTLVEAQTAWAPQVHFLYSYYIFYFYSWTPLSKPLAPFFSNHPNKSNPNRNYPTQNLNKNHKNIHNGDCILAKKNILRSKNQKIMCYRRS